MKKKKCKVCRSEFEPTKPMAVVCSMDCAISLGNLKKAKRERAKVIQDRKETKEKLEKLKTRGDWIKEAQIEFNRYIKFRDSGKGCISCGAECSKDAIGGSGDAGHYRSRGAAPHLRFDEANVHMQCKKCNRHLAGNVAAYRVGLVERIGLEAVEALESDQNPRDHSIDALRAIKALYRAKWKELEKSIG